MYYQIYRDTAGYWRWRLRAANNETLASGEGYNNRSDCLRAVELLKSSYNAPVYE